MAAYPTPHINATPDDFAKTVLMPGDPLRSQFIAENFLENARLVNNVRGVQGYTGTYKGTEVSVMASGMGVPSMGIYSYELFNFFDVDNIIRIGSTGAFQDNIKVRDIILGMGACTNSNYGSQFGLNGAFAPVADFGLLRKAVDIAESMGVRYHVGNVLTSDQFYSAEKDVNEKWRDMGVLSVEMETAALYMNAAKSGKRALAIFTVSDHLFTDEATTAEERQTSFTQMMELALETAISIK
ncbi:MAG: purine-nucleoside phosphorylase [Lachnospiraceae bacterium]|nr:purine-nucleoside phosphorylase [Lachnospiraceae bacterium]